MIKAIDDFLMNLAKKMILIAAFFGINRKQLTHYWVVISYFFCIGIRDFLRDLSKNETASGASVTLLFWFFGSVLVHRLFSRMIIERDYRDDNIISSGLSMTAGFRLFLLTMFPGFSLILIRIEMFSIYFFLSLLFLIPYHFYLYILLNQSPQNPLRLRNLFKNALGKIKQALTPAPQPQPQPSPTAAFAAVFV